MSSVYTNAQDISHKELTGVSACVNTHACACVNWGRDLPDLFYNCRARASN